jgi:hypothetical protein
MNNLSIQQNHQQATSQQNVNSLLLNSNPYNSHHPHQSHHQALFAQNDLNNNNTNNNNNNFQYQQYQNMGYGLQSAQQYFLSSHLNSALASSSSGNNSTPTQVPNANTPTPVGIVQHQIGFHTQINMQNFAPSAHQQHAPGNTANSNMTNGLSNNSDSNILNNNNNIILNNNNSLNNYNLPNGSLINLNSNRINSNTNNSISNLIATEFDLFNDCTNTIAFDNKK